MIPAAEHCLHQFLKVLRKNLLAKTYEDPGRVFGYDQLNVLQKNPLRAFKSADYDQIRGKMVGPLELRLYGRIYDNYLSGLKERSSRQETLKALQTEIDKIYSDHAHLVHAEGHRFRISFTESGLVQIEIFNANPVLQDRRINSYRRISEWWHNSYHDPDVLGKLKSIKMPPGDPDKPDPFHL